VTLVTMCVRFRVCARHAGCMPVEPPEDDGGLLGAASAATPRRLAAQCAPEAKSDCLVAAGKKPLFTFGNDKPLVNSISVIFIVVVWFQAGFFMGVRVFVPAEVCLGADPQARCVCVLLQRTRARVPVGMCVGGCVCACACVRACLRSPAMSSFGRASWLCRFSCALRAARMPVGKWFVAAG
jgi:hypothetical protein